MPTNGSSLYKIWFDSLDPQAAVKVTAAKLRMELGNTSGIKWFAGLGEYVISATAGWLAFRQTAQKVRPWH